MTAEVLTSIRELAARGNDGLQIRLLWCQHDGRLLVTVLDKKTGDAFGVEVHDGERPFDVFQHPFAYGAHHGVQMTASIAAEASSAIAA